VLGLYYYLKIANAMLMRPAESSEPVATSFGLRAALAISAIGTIGIGLFPDVFIKAVNWSLNAPAADSVARLVGR
jgi:NADH-quinone oxidoreductase subunit N